jgi:hypothetical protein
VERLDVYRLHPREEEAAKNVVSRGTVVRGVLVQQAFQVAVSLTLFAVILLAAGYLFQHAGTRVIGWMNCFIF